MTIEVDYRFPTGVDAERQARVIAVGQTAGTWDERFAHRAGALSAHLGRVSAMRRDPDGSTLATVSFPRLNVEGDVPSLLTMIFGKYSMAGPARVEAVRLPEGYGRRPKLGVAGIRRRTGVLDRPLVMAIFKPALGLGLEDHVRLLGEVAAAGLDVIKDDEILGDLPDLRSRARTRACRDAIELAAKRSGKTLLYAVNLTASSRPLHERARELVGEGANALLLNVLSYGFHALESLAADPAIDVPIFAHPALAGAWCGAPAHGLAYGVVLGTLMAAAGADAVLHPTALGSLPFRSEDEAAVRDALRAAGVFPVPSAGVHPGVVPRLLESYGDDVILNAGTGIMEHPGGPQAGVRAFFEALALIRAGTPLSREAVPEGALREALERWGWP